MKHVMYSGIVIIVLLILGFLVMREVKNPVPVNAPTISPSVTPTATPTATPGTVDWKTSTDAMQHVSFQYPETISTPYIHAVDWPPKIQLVKEPFACTQAGSETARAGKTQERTINGHVYCITTVMEGAAGSTYAQYAYAFYRGTQTIILTFTLQFVRCENYDQPAQQSCMSERDTFTPDVILDQIAQTIQF